MKFFKSGGLFRLLWFKMEFQEQENTENAMVQGDVAEDDGEFVNSFRKIEELESFGIGNEKK